jgi:hypothetical protein
MSCGAPTHRPNTFGVGIRAGMPSNTSAVTTATPFFSHQPPRDARLLQRVLGAPIA